MTKRIIVTILTVCFVCGVVFAQQKTKEFIAQGQEHMKSGNYAEAVKAFEAALKLEPKNKLVYKLLNEAKQRRAETQKTLTLSEQQGQQKSPVTSNTVTGQPINQDVETVITKASKVFIEELPKNSIIAVISISSNDLNLTTFAIDELEYQLVMTKQFKIVDRKTLDSIREEQKFQLSGDVSDQSAVSIGNMLGANIVITGNINGIGNNQRLTLKALDVKTAQIITMARESF